MPCPECGYCEDESHKRTRELCGDCAANKSIAAMEGMFDAILMEEE